MLVYQRVTMVAMAKVAQNRWFDDRWPSSVKWSEGKPTDGTQQFRTVVDYFGPA